MASSIHNLDELITLVVAVSIDMPQRQQNYDIHRSYWEGLGIPVIYSYVDYDPSVPFHRTRLLNEGIKKASTPFVAIADVDCLVKLIDLRDALHRSLSTDNFVIPFADVKHIVWDDTVISLDDMPVEFVWNKPPAVTAEALNKYYYAKQFDAGFDVDAVKWPKFSHPTGLFFVAPRETYKSIGMENEYCIDYGFEDIERITRLRTLGYKVEWLDRTGYHLHHSNSSRTRNLMFKNNFFEFMKVSNMTEHELLAYIDTWSWVK